MKNEHKWHPPGFRSRRREPQPLIGRETREHVAWILLAVGIASVGVAAVLVLA